jgi:hypothetical protein
VLVSRYELGLRLAAEQLLVIVSENLTELLGLYSTLVLALLLFLLLYLVGAHLFVVSLVVVLETTLLRYLAQNMLVCVTVLLFRTRFIQALVEQVFMIKFAVCGEG